MLYVYHKIVTRVLSDTTLVLFYKFGKDFINIGLFYFIGFLSFCCSILRRISQENTFILVNIYFILMLIIVCPKIFYIPLLNSCSLRLRSIGKIFIEVLAFYILLFFILTSHWFFLLHFIIKEIFSKKTNYYYCLQVYASFYYISGDLWKESFLDNMVSLFFIVRIVAYSI